MLNLHFEKDAEKFLNSLIPKHFKQVVTAIFKIMSNPEQHDSIPLRSAEFAGLWRNNIGEYRIIYRFDSKTLQIIAS